jgi:hypothetical protein
MTIQQEILERLSTLSPVEQQQLLEFTRSLSARGNGSSNAKPWKSLMGVFAHRGIDITADDIAAARREMWGDFPRDVE